MPKIVSIGICPPPHVLTQDTVVAFARELFGGAYRDISRLLKVFENGQIEKRHFVNDISWFQRDHSFAERNDIYIEQCKELGVQAIRNCLQNKEFLQEEVAVGELDAFFFISSSGISTPSMDARIMNLLPFSPHTKRIPIWGLGCAGGASGLARAFEYCAAFPKAKVLVLAAELCSLTFQRNDLSKSNLIGTSLFADGIAAVLLAGDQADLAGRSALPALPAYVDARSTLMRDAEDVMGWDVRDNGLYVVFSKDIPTLIAGWLRPNVESFLAQHRLTMQDIPHFIAHPGGKKVLEAYEMSLGVTAAQTAVSFDILRQYGNMSSATVLYVLQEYLRTVRQAGELGIVAALGPGFSSELLLVRWEEV